MKTMQVERLNKKGREMFFNMFGRDENRISKEELKVVCVKQNVKINELVNHSSKLTKHLFDSNPTHPFFKDMPAGDIDRLRTLKFGGTVVEHSDDT